MWFEIILRTCTNLLQNNEQNVVVGSKCAQKERSAAAEATANAAAEIPEKAPDKLMTKDSSIGFSVVMVSLPLASSVASAREVRYVITLTGPCLNLKSSVLLYESLGRNLKQLE